MHLREKLTEIRNNKNNLTNYLIAKNIFIFLDQKRIPAIDEIASMSYVNKSTVTRFVQKLNFQGWKQFITELFQEEEKYYPSVKRNQFSKIDSFDFFQHEVINIFLELNHYKKEILEVNQEIKTKEIYIFSSYQTEEIAQDFCENLQILNLNVKWNSKTNKFMLSSLVHENSVCFWIISGSDNEQLVDMYYKLHNVNKIDVVIGTTSQISKLKNSDYTFSIHAGESSMRENIKKILLFYLLNQFINTLINENDDLLLLKTNPKFKF